MSATTWAEAGVTLATDLLAGNIDPHPGALLCWALAGLSSGVGTA